MCRIWLLKLEVKSQRTQVPLSILTVWTEQEQGWRKGGKVWGLSSGARGNRTSLKCLVHSAAMAPPAQTAVKLVHRTQKRFLTPVIPGTSRSRSVALPVSYFCTVTDSQMFSLNIYVPRCSSNWGLEYSQTDKLCPNKSGICTILSIQFIIVIQLIKTSLCQAMY